MFTEGDGDAIAPLLACLPYPGVCQQCLNPMSLTAITVFRLQERSSTRFTLPSHPYPLPLPLLFHHLYISVLIHGPAPSVWIIHPSLVTGVVVRFIVDFLGSVSWPFPCKIRSISDLPKNIALGTSRSSIKLNIRHRQALGLRWVDQSCSIFIYVLSSVSCPGLKADLCMSNS